MPVIGCPGSCQICPDIGISRNGTNGVLLAAFFSAEADDFWSLYCPNSFSECRRRACPPGAKLKQPIASYLDHDA